MNLPPLSVLLTRLKEPTWVKIYQRIGPPGSDIRVGADDFMKYIVAPCAEELGYDKPIRADGLPEPGRITSQIIDLLNSADIVIADLSGQQRECVL